MQRMATRLRDELSLEIKLQILPITVAALMSPAWIAKYLEVPHDCDRILLPG